MDKTFARNFDSLAAVYEFAEQLLAKHKIDEAVRFPVHLSIEELFTNMVKYNPDSESEIDIDIVVEGGLVTVTLTEDDVDEFDVTRSTNVNPGASLVERVPGGLGLYLLQNLVDSLEYCYEGRRSRVIFTKESGQKNV